MDGKMIKVLQGHLTDLPPVQSQLVRIFTSSTFTDTYTERNMLIEEIYPKLKEYCKNKYDIDFQVVDMRWGVRDEASDDHSTSGLCLEEIENCQKLSSGPNFVTFLGQRYGYRPIPSKISATEFETLLKALEKSGEDTEVIEQWYWKDDNEIPSVYNLQRISSQIPYYTSQDENKRNDAKQKWSKVYNKLQNSLRHGAELCSKENLMSDQEKHKYFMSVTESEIQCGMFEMQGNVNEHCLGFIRIIKDLGKNLDHRLAWRFIDMAGDATDEVAQKFMKTLRDEKIPKYLSESNLYRSHVKWDSTSGISKDIHEDYLKQFGDDFYKATVARIDQAMLHIKHLEENELFLEALQHAKLAQQRCDLFHGREDILGNIQALIDKNTKQPIVVHGQSGCGKTSIMAICAEKVRTWVKNGNKSVVVLRFLGTTLESSNIISVLSSICKQIAYNYGQEYKDDDNLNDLIIQFDTLLKCATKEKPLIIILDSLDQLSSANYAHKLTWLNSEVPENVHFVVSTLPVLYDILNTLKKKKINENNFVRIQSLGDKLGLEILDTWLKKSKRKLSDEQYAVVQGTFAKCSLPLFVRLLYEEVLLWKSYSPLSELLLSFSIREVINDLFTRLEKKHGQLFMSHSLGYITASKSGLSETEIEDILSLDDEVLTDVFQYHVPPMRRVPQLLIVRLRHDIRQYLVNREADGVVVTYWYHRQFIEAAQDRYLKVQSQAKEIHKLLAEYFMGKWHNTKKPFRYTAIQMKKLNASSPNAEADRRVMAQPLCYIDTTDNGILLERYNKRKISNLPYHLAQAGMNDQILENCLLNYDWLRAKTRAFSLREALNDYSYVSSSSLCLRIVQSLNLSRSTLSKFPKSLGSELLARLTYLIGKTNIKENGLFQQMLTKSIKQGSKENRLVPKGQMFSEIDDRLKYTLEYPNLTANWKIVCFSPDGLSLLAVAHPNHLIVWDLRTGEIEKQLTLWPEKDPKLNVYHISSDQYGEKRYLLLASCYQSHANPVVMVDLVQGEIIHAVKLRKYYPKLAFVENLQMELIDDKVLMNVIGDECCFFSLESGEVVHTFQSASKMMNVLPNKTKVVFYLKEKPCFEVYSLVDMQMINSVVCEEVPAKLLSISDGTLAIPKAGKSITFWDFDTAKGNKCQILTTINLEKYLFENNIMNAYLSQNHQLLLISYHHGIIVWNIKTNKFIQKCDIPVECKPFSYKVSQYQASITCDNQLVLAAYEEFVIVWSLKSNQVSTMKLATTTSRVLDIFPSPHPSQQIAVAVIARVLLFQVLDLTKFQSMNKQRWVPHMKMISGVRYLDTAETCSKIVSRSYKPDNVYVFDALKNEIIISDFQEHEVMKPRISQDGSMVVLMRNAAKFSYCCLDIYDADTGKIVCTLEVDSTRLRTYSFSSDAKYFVTHCEDSPTERVEIAIWKVQKGSPKVKVMKTDVGGISYIEFVQKDTMIACFQQYPQVNEGRDCKLRIYDVETGEQLFKMGSLIRDCMYTVLDKPFLYITTAGSNTSQDIFCEFNLEKLSIAKQHKIRPIGNVTLTKDGVYGVDTAIQVFNLREGKLLYCFGDIEKPMIKRNRETYPRLSNDGNYVVWLNLHEGSVNLGHVPSKSLVGKTFTHSIPLSIKMTCDNIVAVGTDEGYILLYDVVDSSDNIEKICDSVINASKKSNLMRRTTMKSGPAKSSNVCSVL